MKVEPERRSLSRRFVRLAVLNILSNLMVPLAGLVDMALLGHLPEIRHLAGVALGSILFDYVYWTFGFLRMATTGLTAQAVGRRDPDEVLVTALRGWSLGLTIGVLILLLQTPIARAGFWVIGGEQGAESAGLAYFHARIWGAPATLLNFVFLGWFLGREQAGRALLLSVVGNGANVLLDWIFIFRLGWAAQGAGFATALSQYLMLACAVAFAARDLDPASMRRLLPRALLGEGLRETFRLNRDILVRTLALISVFAAFTNVASTLGTVLLAATAVVKQVVTLAAFFIDGFAFATESLAGILDGEGDRRGLRRLLGMALGLSLVTGLLFALLFNLFGLPLFRLFTDHADVLAEIVRYAPWLFGVLATGSVAYALDGYFIGLVQGRILSRAMLLAALVGFAPAGVWAWHLQSADALWAALSIFMLARTLTLAVKVPETLRGA